MPASCRARGCASAISPGARQQHPAAAPRRRDCRRRVPLLRADRSLDRRAAVEGRARAQPGRARRPDILRRVGIPGDAELGSRGAGSTSSSSRACCASIRRSSLRRSGRSRSRRCRRRCRPPRSSPIRRPASTSGTRRLGSTCATGCPARLRRIRSRMRSTARCGRCRSSCGCTSCLRSQASSGSSRVAQPGSSSSSR